jgi:hypothetical protein
MILSGGPQIVQIYESHQSAVADEKHAAPIGADAATEALKQGPIGALILSAIAVGLLFVGWILIYFLLFIGRGPVG